MASHSLSHEHLLAALERRFDYLSARSVANELLSAAGVAKADHYDAAAAAKLRAAAETSLTRAHGVLEALAAGAPAKAHATPESATPTAAAVAALDTEAVVGEAVAAAEGEAKDAAPHADAHDKADKKKKA
jgi:hypothetical protein